MTHPRPDTIRAVPRRHYGQSAFAVVAVVFVLSVTVSIYRNPNIDHPTIAEFITSAPIMQGLVTTIQLTVLAAVIGSAIGLVVALMRMSSNRVLQSLAWLYLWFFRGVPLLVQILFWGNFGLFFSHLELGVPFTDIQFFSVPTATVVTTFVASVIGLALHESAYMAEIFRGGILGVDRGQTDAAQALGMGRLQALRRIVLPQALRVIIPPAGNQYISLLKASSLVSVIAGGDLLTRAENIGAVTLRSLELLAVATFWYLVIVSVASIGQYFVERHYGRGYAQ
jgi:polar amino acid transport system permease protein